MSMASEREVLAAKSGVILEQVTLRSGSGVVAVAFVVKSRRTPEVPNFGDFHLDKAAILSENYAVIWERLQCQPQNSTIRLFRMTI
jgi:hypothetical protein